MFRRGKLTFLTTKDDRVKIINDRINITEKHFMEICAAFAECSRKMAKYRDSYDELAKGLKSYADDEEINESLTESLKSMTTALTLLGDYMDLNIKRVEGKVINDLATFDTICKSTRENMRTAVIARDKEVLKQRQMLELKSKFSANSSAADSELLKAKVEVNRANKEIDGIICNFEKKKLNEIKRILTDFILISMKYHTKVLETLSSTYYDISNIDEKADFGEFQKLMKSKDESRKSGIKKGIRSQSMESLDRDHILSPLKRQHRLSKSTKNLTKSDEDEEQDDNEEDDDEDESDADSNPDDEESGTVSEDEHDTSESVSEAKPTKVDSQTSKLKTQAKDPFKTAAAAAATAAHIGRAPKPCELSRPSASRTSTGIPVSARTLPLPIESHEPTLMRSISRNSFTTSTGRLVTVMETNRYGVSNKAADSTKATTNVQHSKR